MYSKYIVMLHAKNYDVFLQMQQHMGMIFTTINNGYGLHTDVRTSYIRTCALDRELE
jgi:hypothetical protein